MKVSSKGRYGTRALLELALAGTGEVLSLSQIAKRQGISEKYLDHLFVSLKKAALVKSRRGAGGGYSLAKKASQIKLSDIILALEGSLSPVDCLDHPRDCARWSSCVTRNVWQKLKDNILKTLESINLADLVKEQQGRKAGLDYDI